MMVWALPALVALDFVSALALEPDTALVSVVTVGLDDELELDSEPESAPDWVVLVVVMVGFACAPDNEPAIAPEPEVEVEVCDQALEPVTIATMPIVAQSLFMMIYPV